MFGKLNDLDIRLIKVFVTITQAGGITPAQALLNVGQPTISMQLAALEERLGYRLCRRGRSGFALTPRGEQFLAASKALLAAIGTFELQARNLDKALVGTLTLGLIGHSPIDINTGISAAIARFGARQQAVRLSVTVHSPAELEQMLLAGMVDVAISYFWRRMPTLDYLPLGLEEEVAYCGSSHVLGGRAGAVTIEEADRHDWVWRGSPLVAEETRHIPPTIVAICDNMEGRAILILSGRYLGYLPSHFAEPYMRAGQLVALNRRTLRHRVRFELAARKPPHRNEIVEAFLRDVVDDREPAASPRARSG